MAKYKHIDMQPQLIEVDWARQLLTGALEHALHHFLEHEIDLVYFSARLRNGDTGARVSLAVLLKVVLFAYFLGIVSNRSMKCACHAERNSAATHGRVATWSPSENHRLRSPVPVRSRPGVIDRNKG